MYLNIPLSELKKITQTKKRLFQLKKLETHEKAYLKPYHLLLFLFFSKSISGMALQKNDHVRRDRFIES